MGVGHRRLRVLARFCGMSPAIDLTGKTFGLLTVIERASSKQRAAHWLCRCECSPTVRVVVRSDSLVQGRTRSCGCSDRGSSAPRRPRAARLGPALKIGDKRSSLVLRAYVGEGVTGPLWRLDCACGKPKIIPRADVLAGRVTDCGTYDIANERISQAYLAELIVNAQKEPL